MTVALKEKPFEGALEPSARLFGQLGELLSKPTKRMTPAVVSTGVKRSIQQIKKQASLQEILVLREVVNELASHLSTIEAEMAGSQPESDDAAVDRALAKAAEGKSPVFTTTESIQQGEEIMTQARIDAANNLAERIKRGEYITSGQLQDAWQVKRAAISNAVAAGRLFSVVGPSGENYYPAFFADPTLDRRVLEKVAKALGTLPSATKFHFFTSKLYSLGESPLDALRKGRVEPVLAAAKGIVEC